MVQARTQVCRFGGKIDFRMVKFLFLLCLKENFSRQNKFGERKKLGEHCPRIPPVATGLQVSQHDAKLG